MVDLVRVAHYYDPEEAQCAKSFLQSCGIYVYLKNEHHLSVSPSLRFALGGYPLLTVSQEAEEAHGLLRGVLSEPVEMALNPEDEIKPSPRLLAWIPLAFMMAVPFVPMRGRSFMFVWKLIVLVLMYAMQIYYWFG